MKKRIGFLSLIGLGLLLIPSCGLLEDYSTYYADDDLEIASKDIDIIDANNQYTLSGNNKLTTYFIKDDSLPYANPYEFLNALKGYSDFPRINHRYDYFNGSYKITYLNYYVEFNYKTNTISAPFLSGLGISKSSETTDYSSSIRSGKSNYFRLQSSFSTVFNIGDYGFDILYYEKTCLVPVHFLNLMYCSFNMTNLYYNGVNYYFTYGNINETSEEIINEFYSGPLKGTTKTQKEANDNYNFICFLFDNLYGLKEYKNIDKLDSWLDNDLKAKLHSTNPGEYNDGLYTFVFNKLNELHTRISGYSIYTENELDVRDYYGTFYNAYLNKREELRSICDLEDNSISYINNSAIIHFESFKTAPNSVIFDENNHVKDDAYLYDTYFLFSKYLNEIRDKGGIDNVVLDISLNGGGNVGALIRALTFLTNDDVWLKQLNYLTNYLYKYSYSGDTNLDGSYNDQDAFDEFNYYVLTGINTFSAANIFSSACKDQKLAKIIGQKSGGGMCSVFPTVLIDGTSIDFSSTTNVFVSSESNTSAAYDYIESGVDVDIEIDYENFYNLEFIDNLINS